MTVKIREIPKGSGKWWLKIDYHQRRKSVLCKSKEDAIDAADGLERMLEAYGEKALEVLERRRQAQETKEEPAAPTVKEFAKRWAAELEKRDLKHSTRVSYIGNLKHHIIPSLGDLPIDRVDYATCKAWVVGKVQGSYSTARFRKVKDGDKEVPAAGQERTYSRDSVRIMVMTLRALMAEAVRERLVETNPVADLATFYRRKRDERVVRRSEVYSLDELYKVEDVLAGQRVKFEADAYEFFLTMSRTGMRIGEACGLKPSDLDYQARTIEIQRNIPSGTGLLEDSTKGKAGHRTVDMGLDLYAALKTMEARRRECALASGARPGEWLFPSPGGGPADYSRVYDDWQRANRLAGVRFRSPHSLRHTYASVNLSRGEDLAYVSRQLGHANPGTTLAIYTHFMPRARRRSAGAMDRSARDVTDRDIVRRIPAGKTRK